MATYGYVRASIDGQMLEAQLEKLHRAGCDEIHREKMSGARSDRPELADLLAKIAEGDILIVDRLDHLARSTRDLLSIIEALDKRGATFRSLGDPWADTTATDGRLISAVLAGLAAFERDLLRTRTGGGRERAKARGQHMGRPKRLTPQQHTEALQALAAGTATQADLARRFSVSQSTISRLADKASASSPPPSSPIDTDTAHAARAFLVRLKGRYPIVDTILYGSRARGDHKPDSDADLAVILRGDSGARSSVALDMAGIAFHVMMETGIMVEALPFWETELTQPEQFPNPALIANILREGVYL